MHILLLGLSLLLFQQESGSQVSFPNQPPAGTYFVDEARLIDAATGRAINEIAAYQERHRQIRIFVVTIPSLAAHGAAGYTVEEYARALMDEWGIGAGYQMLLLVSRGDRQARIELGRFWAHSQDHRARQVMNDLILPEFRRERYAAGILWGTRGMQAIAAGTTIPKRGPSWAVLPAALAALLGIACALLWPKLSWGRTSETETRKISSRVFWGRSGGGASGRW